MLHALETATGSDKDELHELLNSNPADKVKRVLAIFKNCGVDDWAKHLKENYVQSAFERLEDTAVVAVRKKPLKELAEFLVKRDY